MTLGRERIDPQLVRQGADSNPWIHPLFPQQLAPGISPVNDADLAFRIAEGAFMGLPALAAPELATPLVGVAAESHRRLSLSYARMNGGMPWTRTTLPFQGAHCLANRSGPLVRLTFQIG